MEIDAMQREKGRKVLRNKVYHANGLRKVERRFAESASNVEHNPQSQHGVPRWHELGCCHSRYRYPAVIARTVRL